jgi:hypothetical protein
MKKTLKRALCLVLTVLVLASMACVVASANDGEESVFSTANIVVGNTNTPLIIGDEFTYVCKLKYDSTIENGQFTLNYPENFLEIKSVDFPLISDVMYNYTESVTDKLKFNFSNIATGYDFSNDDSILVNVVFMVKNAGDGEITLDKEVLSNMNDANALNEAVFTETVIAPERGTEATEPTTVDNIALEEQDIGKELTYTCQLICDSIIENGQFTLNYPEELLEIEAVNFPVATDTMYNYTDNVTGALKFNFSNINPGYDFSNKADLVNVVFKVKSAGTGKLYLNKEKLSDMNDTDVLENAFFTETIIVPDHNDNTAETTEVAVTSTDSNTAPTEESTPTSDIISTDPIENNTTESATSEPIETAPVVTPTDTNTDPTDPAENIPTSPIENPTEIIPTDSTEVTNPEQNPTEATIDNSSETSPTKVSDSITNVNDSSAKTTISLKKSSAKIYVSGKTTIKATVKNGNGKTTYKSSNTKVAKVNKNGKVTALKKGTAKITVTNNGVSKTFKVTVKNPTLNAKSKIISKGKTFTLKITGKVGKATFKSSNSKVAKVSKNGKITAKKKGKATITVKTNGIKLTCKVRVK